MVTREERRLSAFLFERYCAALAKPNARTQDALANGLRVAHRRVRQKLEICFADEDIDAAQRHRLLSAYGALDAGVEMFWRVLAEHDPNWVERGSELVRLVERVHALACAHRQALVQPAMPIMTSTVVPKGLPTSPPPARSDHSEPGAPASFEDEDTQVFERSSAPQEQTEVARVR